MTAPEGGEVGAIFARRVLTRQAAVGALAFLTVNLLAPWSLMLESRTLARIWLMGLVAGAFAVTLSAISSLPPMREARAVFRALALEPERMEAADVGILANLPFALTARFIVAGALAAALTVAPGIRPAQLDEARLLSLALLTFTIVAASAVVHYVAIRDATVRAIELSPSEPIVAWLERESMRLAPSKRVTRKILFAVVAPVALAGVGTVLVTHAHLRAAVERSRHATAVYLARAALDPVDGIVLEASRDDAIAAAAAHGFVVQPKPHDLEDNREPIERTAGGQLTASVPLAEGHALVRYTAELSGGHVTLSTWIALLAVLLAGALGFVLGRGVANDLVLATQQVSSLGTESVMKGTARVEGPARFAAVADLGRSVEALAERFRIFAAAQERALEARVAAQRMKQLLFASVSHDLKSPLNAILGFAEIVRDEPLSQPQVESLDMVIGRGRELLALIETILDAARVEAGEMQLLMQPVSAHALLQEAVAKARDLHPLPGAQVVVEIAPGLPYLLVDPAHAARSLAVLIAHALDNPQAVRTVTVRATLPASDRGYHLVCVQIECAAQGNTPSLVQAQLEGSIAGGRGGALRMGLARAIVELHGGRVDVGRGAHGSAVVTCWLPSAPLAVHDDMDAPTLVLPSRRR